MNKISSLFKTKIVGLKSSGLYVLVIISIFFSACSSDKNENNSNRDTISNVDTPQVNDIRVDKPDTLDNGVPPPPPVKILEIVKFVPPVVVDEPPPPDIPERIVYADDGNWKSDQNGDEPIMDLEGTIDIPMPQSDVFLAVEQMPEFVGGEVAMMQFIKDNMKYPEAAKSNGVEGKVKVKFTVNKNGSLSDFNIISKEKLGYGCEEEAIRLIKSMPNWKPGKQNGNAVNVYYYVPITFRLF